MKWLALLITLIFIAGCEHSHPVVEHNHDHEHVTVADILHRELVGTYRLEETERELVGSDEKQTFFVDFQIRG